MAESTKELTEQGAKVTTTVAGSSATAAPPAEPDDVLRRLASLEAWQKQASLGQRGTPPDRREEQRIATEKLERYTGSPIAAFQPWVIITNFNDYIPIFAREFGGGAEPTKGSTWVCAHSPERGVSIINYNMGSPNAAIVVDVLSRIPGVFELVLFAGMVGGLPSYGTYDRALQVGDLFLDTDMVLLGEAAQFSMWIQAEATIGFKSEVDDEGVSKLVFDLEGFDSLMLEVVTNQGMFEGDDAGLVDLIANTMLPLLLDSLAGDALALEIPAIDVSELSPDLPEGTALNIDLQEFSRKDGYLVIDAGLK